MDNDHEQKNDNRHRISTFILGEWGIKLCVVCQIAVFHFYMNWVKLVIILREVGRRS